MGHPYLDMSWHLLRFIEDAFRLCVQEAAHCAVAARADSLTPLDDSREALHGSPRARDGCPARDDFAGAQDDLALALHGLAPRARYGPAELRYEVALAQADWAPYEWREADWAVSGMAPGARLAVAASDSVARNLAPVDWVAWVARDLTVDDLAARGWPEAGWAVIGMAPGARLAMAADDSAGRSSARDDWVARDLIVDDSGARCS